MQTLSLVANRSLYSLQKISHVHMTDLCVQYFIKNRYNWWWSCMSQLFIKLIFHLSFGFWWWGHLVCLCCNTKISKHKRIVRRNCYISWFAINNKGSETHWRLCRSNEMSSKGNHHAYAMCENEMNRMRNEVLWRWKMEDGMKWKCVKVEHIGMCANEDCWFSNATWGFQSVIAWEMITCKCNM